tara:strand:- start:55218 stop:56435 length:1218 start_codon:yes stop_codon:yes gene_type:complete
MNSKVIVFIYPSNSVKAIPAGVFELNDGIGTFSYGNRYINNVGIPVSPDLPIQEGEMTTDRFNGLFASFADATPDFWGRTVYSSLHNKPFDNISETELLLSVSGAQIGNLDFRLEISSPEPKLVLPGFSSLSGLIDAAEDIQAGREVDQAYQQMLDQGTSMGGMRPKCTVQDGGKLWIAKFPSNTDTYSASRIEMATMTLARLSGITVPEIKVISIGGKDTFLIERFDRQASPDGYLRLGFSSCLSLLGKHEMDRGLGYPDLAIKLRAEGDIKGAHELFTRMLFNMGVRNTDDHAKNHGVIMDSQMRLSPAFDITPALSRDGISTEFDLAINVGKHGRQATIQNALSSSEQFGLTESDAREIADKVNGVLSDWRTVFEDQGVCKKDIATFENTFSQLIPGTRSEQ